ncbi:hypothetical protein LP421_08600 [Rhizobium sp. RCAM05350]|nr:hypothetical protein LP421_08600 [Rhizobium sp. RCAM05350]
MSSSPRTVFSCRKQHDGGDAWLGGIGKNAVAVGIDITQGHVQQLLEGRRNDVAAQRDEFSKARWRDKILVQNVGAQRIEIVEGDNGFVHQAVARRLARDRRTKRRFGPPARASSSPTRPDGERFRAIRG